MEKGELMERRADRLGDELCPTDCGNNHKSVGEGISSSYPSRSKVNLHNSISVTHDGCRYNRERGEESICWRGAQQRGAEERNKYISPNPHKFYTIPKVATLNRLYLVHS